jgi:hypothetical protein
MPSRALTRDSQALPISLQRHAAIVISEPGDARDNRKENMFEKAKKLSLGLAALIGTAVGGAAIAGAATSGSTTTTTTTTVPSPQQPPAMNMPMHGTASHEDAEKAVTGANATKAQEAAVKAAGGGTAGDVTTDYFGNGYEVTVTQSDGSSVEYHLDSSFNVMSRPGGGPGGGPPGWSN